MDPGTIIAVTQIAFSGAYSAVKVINKAVKFSGDSAELVVRLEVERFRLETWNVRSGLAEDTLAPHLLVGHEILLRQLQLIKDVFKGVEKYEGRYGLAHEDPQPEDKQDNETSSWVDRMRQTLRDSGVGKEPKDPLKQQPLNETPDGDENVRKSNDANIWRRMQWGIRDRDQLASCIDQLEKYVDKLNQLLSETQQREVGKDVERIRIIVVGSAQDQNSIKLIESAVRLGNDDAGTQGMAARKALLGIESESLHAPTKHLQLLKRGDFCLPRKYEERNRTIVGKKGSPDQIVMLERKAYDRDLGDHKKRALRLRLRRLTMLLNSSKAASFQVATAIGYFDDAENHCWWLAFDFPGAGNFAFQQLSAEPLSLSYLLQSSTKFRPPYEQRQKLALSICETMSDLYSSGWLHKSLRSANILFPALVLSKSAVLDRLICNPTVSGFEYSRQESEAQTIDRARDSSDISVAIYRHPLYQGEAAEGYRFEYDLYSLGLVLLEVALWVPLLSLLDAKAPPGSAAAEVKPVLSSQMGRFHHQEALILQQRVTDRVEKVLAFHMGTVYYEAVKWCLSQGDESNQDSSEDMLYPALGFYNNVVAPLRAVASSN